MKVIGAEVFHFSFEVAPAWHPIILRVHTDEGISGLGEIGLAYGTGHRAAVGMLVNLAEGFLIGTDPFEQGRPIQEEEIS